QPRPPPPDGVHAREATLADQAAGDLPQDQARRVTRLHALARLRRPREAHHRLAPVDPRIPEQDQTPTVGLFVIIAAEDPFEVPPGVPGEPLQVDLRAPQL